MLWWLAWQDAQGHNPYVRMCLFAPGKGTTQKNALPSPWIWRDDVKDLRTAFSTLLETSEGNHQALIRLDRPATTVERKRLMTAWRNKYEDSDDCSADPIHFVRVPGTHNTKRGGSWRVRCAERNSRTFSADRLLERCGGDTPLSDRVSAARAEQHDADDWKKLPDGRRLLDSPRYQGIITGRPQLRTMFVDKQCVILTNKNGKTDDSMSAQRAVFVQNLITAWSDKNPGHLPENEIRAVALSLRPQLGKGKTAEQYKVDIDWLINRYRPTNYRPKRTMRLAPKRERGRPAGLGAQTKSTLQQIAQVAPDEFGRRVFSLDALGVPRRTAQYRIAQLRAKGLIRTGQIGGNGPLYAILCETGGAQVNSLPVDAPVLPAETQQTAHADDAHHGETEIPREECVSPDRASDVAPPEPPTLAELAKNYLDQPASAIGMRCVSRKTGQISYRRTAKHFASLVTAEYSYTAAEAIAAYQCDRALKQAIATAQWRRFFDDLRAMSDDELIAYVGGGCRRAVSELIRDGSTFDKHLYATRLKCAKQHLKWRGLKMPKRKSKVAEQAAHDAAAAQKAVKRLEERQPRKRLVACEPIHYAQPAEAPSGIVARLQALKAERAAAGGLP